MKDLQKPCHDCAFRRDSTPGHLGGSEPEVYIGQTFGPFYIPCHLTYGEHAENIRDHLHCTGGCAGSAIFRANIGVDSRMPKGVNKLPADHDLVFSTPAEFLAHHKGISVDRAQWELTQKTPLELYFEELSKAEVRFLDEKRAVKR